MRIFTIGYDCVRLIIKSKEQHFTMASSLRILAFGASLTEGYYFSGLRFHPYAIRLGQLLRPSFLAVDIENAGVSGEAVLSSTMLPRLKQLLSSASNHRYDWVLLLAGTNDVMRDQQKASRVFDGFKLLISECHKHGARVLCMTLPETAVPKELPVDFERQGYNRFIREELTTNSSEKDKIVVLDVDRLLPYHALSPDERKKIWDDEVHLTPKGYDRLGELIYEALRTHL